MLKRPVFRATLVNGEGFVSSVWRSWFQDLQNFIGNAPFPLKSYTVSTVPTASAYTGHVIYVSDETGGAQPAFSDGTNWRRFSDRTIIS